MGHLINPISFRIGHKIFWKSNWSIYKKTSYVTVFKKDILTFKYINWYIKELNKNNFYLEEKLLLKDKIQIKKLQRNFYIIKKQIKRIRKSLKEKMKHYSLIPSRLLYISIKRELRNLESYIYMFKDQFKRYKYFLFYFLNKKNFWVNPFSFEKVSHYKIYRTLNSFISPII